MPSRAAKPAKKIVLAVTGASGAVYAQRLLDFLSKRADCAVDVVMTSNAAAVAEHETGGLRIPKRFKVHDDRNMFKPFASGSAKYDAMVVVPCSMGMLGRIAHGYSDSVTARAADVFLKERRRLVLVPRETPLNLIHARNIATVIEAGAVVIPACPSFYGRPKNITELVDTVVARVLDHIGVENDISTRWMS